jgi:integrase
MPAPRKPLTLELEGNFYVVRFRHPTSQKVVRWKMGKYPLETEAAESRFRALNRVFLNEAEWLEPNLPHDLKEMWKGAKAGVRFVGKEKQLQVDGQPVESTVINTGKLYAIIENLTTDLAAARAEASKFRRLYEGSIGRKSREGASPTLQQALDNWTANYVGRDPDHTRIVTNDLKRFVAHFKPDTEIDSLDGKERDVDTWLRGLKIQDGIRKGQSLSAGRRFQIRTHVLAFMRDSGTPLKAEAIHRPSKDDVRADRGEIRWLEKGQAQKLAAELPAPWCDYFRVQVGTGLRPDELITLKRSDFTKDFSRLTLSEYGALTLKQGPRTIMVPVPVREIIKRRLDGDNNTVFPDTTTDAPWVNPKTYNRFYLKALRKAASDAGIKVKVDCRTGRRTCGSLLLRAKQSIEQVAAILGDRVETVREHYAKILSKEVDPSAAALK